MFLGAHCTLDQDVGARSLPPIIALSSVSSFFCEKPVKQQIIAIVRLKSLILFMKIAINQRNNNIKYKIQIPLYANAEFRFNCRIWLSKINDFYCNSIFISLIKALGESGGLAISGALTYINAQRSAKRNSHIYTFY